LACQILASDQLASQLMFPFVKLIADVLFNCHMKHHRLTTTKQIMFFNHPKTNCIHIIQRQNTTQHASFILLRLRAIIMTLGTQLTKTNMVGLAPHDVSNVENYRNPKYFNVHVTLVWGSIFFKASSTWVLLQGY
jgi:hypothetical protein